ncbi:hypothetical protein [Amycolatopsis alkalitolerans]|uniref:Uncharacterized protein n=1 Tax=Amycolatopsis alkalitolerans TaxID=2547244 RepID=A0A5C4LZX2_9PSEU|nr:hypothetical protein [Amycolatopsis alkalitolerans]TNC23706.1 hypothetical protein FG385_20290 [Amycolatopsis alkalitolerans]
MSDNKSGKNVVEWLFRACVLVLGTTIALNVAIMYLQPVLPWLLGGFALALLVWLTVAIVRWQRSKW